MELFIPTVIRLPDTLHVKHVLELGVREQLRSLVRRLLPPPLPEVLQDVPHGRALQRDRIKYYYAGYSISHLQPGVDILPGLPGACVLGGPLGAALVEVLPLVTVRLLVSEQRELRRVVAT